MPANGIVYQQAGRWHRQRNRFGKLWAQTKVTAQLAISYFDWTWLRSRTRDSAAQLAGFATRP
ncbi:hypothetical protein S7335_3419 [Synechococcus sp. PCC 7335]|nr:hypothetical protein S7335_3419 [Synechococcus sp. PCC 7335]